MKKSFSLFFSVFLFLITLSYCTSGNGISEAVDSQTEQSADVYEPEDIEVGDGGIKDVGDRTYTFQEYC